MSERLNAIEYLTSILTAQDDLTRTGPDGEHRIDTTPATLAERLTDLGYRAVMTPTDLDPLATAQRLADTTGEHVVLEIGDENPEPITLEPTRLEQA